MTGAQVGIVGSGMMATGVAEVAVLAGHEVIVRARKSSSADAVVAGVAKSLERQVSKGRLDGTAREAALARLSPTDSLADLYDCDLVIENVVEDLAVKKDVMCELGSACRPTTILATNTSTLPVVELAVASGRPDKVVGIHFFNPAPAMQLVEIVAPLTASEATVAWATEFAQGCGKETVAVADRAGFVVNALLFPYLNNAVRLWEQGTASIDDIDRAMMGGCGFPMGPFALLDLVGLDTSVSILDALSAEFGDPNYKAVPTLRCKVAAGHLGRKSGQGFLSYR